MIRIGNQNARSAHKSAPGFMGQLVRAVFAIGVLAIGAFVFAFSAAIIVGTLLIVAAGVGIWLLQRKLRGLPSPFAVFTAWPPQRGAHGRAADPSTETAHDDWLSRTEKSVKARSSVTIEGELVDRK